MFDFFGENMKKRFFGIKLNTVLTVILCLVAAVAFWLLVKYTESTDPAIAYSAISSFRGFL